MTQFERITATPEALALEICRNQLKTKAIYTGEYELPSKKGCRLYGCMAQQRSGGVIVNGCRNCSKMTHLDNRCPWGGTYHHLGEHGEKIGICNAYERKTNGDQIRAMSNEELAVTLMCPNEMGMADIPCDHSDEKNCCRCLLDWLNSEVKEREAEA